MISSVIIWLNWIFTRTPCVCSNKHFCSSDVLTFDLLAIIQYRTFLYKADQYICKCAFKPWKLKAKLSSLAVWKLTLTLSSAKLFRLCLIYFECSVHIVSDGDFKCTFHNRSIQPFLYDSSVSLQGALMSCMTRLRWTWIPLQFASVHALHISLMTDCWVKNRDWGGTCTHKNPCFSSSEVGRSWCCAGPQIAGWNTVAYNFSIKGDA